MNGKLIVHGVEIDASILGFPIDIPIKILINKQKVGSVRKREKTLIDIEKDCTLTLKCGFSTSEATAITDGMLTEIQCMIGADGLKAEIIRCVPYNPEKENSIALQKMKNAVIDCQKGKISTSVAVNTIIDLQHELVDWTDEVEEKVMAFMDELNALCKEDSDNNTNEHRMRCNVCGHIFCYTDDDLAQNTKNASVGALSAIGALASTLGGGTIFHTNHLQGQADRYNDKIVDFNRCPNCNSTNINPLKGENVVAEKNQQENKHSNLDEIKKYKELLDLDIISQEEFDAKKKQLLEL